MPGNCARPGPTPGMAPVWSGDIMSTALKGSTQLQVHTVRAYTFLIPLVALTSELAYPPTHPLAIVLGRFCLE